MSLSWLPSGWAKSSKGKLHFVAIHDRALTAAEVASHFQAGVGQTFLLRFDVVNRGDAICHIARIEDHAVADAAVAALPDDLERGTEDAVLP